MHRLVLLIPDYTNQQVTSTCCASHRWVRPYGVALCLGTISSHPPKRIRRFAFLHFPNQMDDDAIRHTYLSGRPFCPNGSVNQRIGIASFHDVPVLDMTGAMGLKKISPTANTSRHFEASTTVSVPGTSINVIIH